MFRNDYLNDYYDEWACDYAHLNSFQITSDNKYIYLSYRNIGVVVIEKETKKIVSKHIDVDFSYGEFIEINEHSSLFQVLFSYFDIKDTHEESETILYFAEQ